jgi:hypothetical protein
MKKMDNIVDVKKQVVKSVQNSDKDILLTIKNLYLSDEHFDLDPCYSIGKMYEDLEKPIHKLDKFPQFPDVVKNDILNGLPFENSSIKNIIFDPPFMFGKHGKTDENIMAKRFSMFDTWDALEKMYKKSLEEFYRVLVKGGIVAFKCQDYTDSRTTLTHCFVYNWAIEKGFKVEDLFILLFQGGRIWNSNLIQKHSRKYHCYWFVLKK